MNRIARFCIAQSGTSWLILLLVSVVAGWLASSIAVGYRIDERRSLLETEAQRRSLEVMSQTLNGNLMGSMALLGLIDADIKSEALGKQISTSQILLHAFESVGRAYDAQGVFLVPSDGVITLSWDSAGKPSTGLNVRFRPYYQMALKGKNNVYAAVSLARGDRALYFSAPVLLGATNGTESVGAIVARTGVQKVDELLRGKADIALLLSPQGVVFASSRKEWIGHLSGTPTPERLQAIRELKQFGNLFEKRDPPVLPMSAEPGVCEVDGSSYAVASAKVQWNDPMGDWSLVLMEDLTRTVPLTERLRYGAGAGFIVLLIGVVLIRLLRSHSDQLLAGEQLAAYSSQQQKAGTRKIELSEAGLQMQQVQQVDELLPGYFSAAHRMFGAFQGVAYLVDRVTPDMMVLAGSYACAELPPAELAMGEGLLGQCAVEKRSQLINTTAAGFATIRSGLGETSPAALLLAPIMLHDRLLGVVELALLHKPDSAEQEQFADMVGLLAMNIEILERTAQTKEMLSAAVAAEQEMARLADIERFNRLAQGREQRILELKHEINALAVEAGKMPPYVMTLVEIVDDSDHPDDRTDLTLDTSTLQLSDLVDLTDLQNLFTAFCESVGIASAIIDLEGTVLVSANWQRACTGFHRVNTESCKLCIESDTELALQLQTGQDFTMYTCKNGMTDAASPIVVEGRHLANVFIGQFHLGPPDLDFFRQQALHFGYPEAEYLLAVSEGPVVDERRMPVILGFLSGFARMIGTMSLARYRADAAQAKLQEQAELLRRERLAAMSLAEDAEAFRQMKQQGVPL